MKIVLLTSWLSRNGGGVSEAVRGLALACRSANADVTVLGLADKEWHRDAVQWQPVPIRAFEVSGPDGFGYARGLSQALCDLEPDLVHVHGLWMFPSLGSLLWSSHTGRPVIVSPHGMLDRWALQHSRWKKRLANVYEYWNLRRAVCLHALCEAESEAIRAFGLKNPVVVIPNGILPHGNFPLCRPPWDDHNGPRKTILYIGRLHPKKGLVPLIQAWAAVSSHAQENNWQLCIVGWDQDGYEVELRAIAKQLGVTASLHFLGPVFGAQKHTCYSWADAFVLPSLSEGLPLTVLEAWSYKLPILITPQCNFNIGYDANAAVRIEADVASIARGFRTLFLMSDEQRHEMGRAGLALVDRYYRWEKIAAEMISVYDRAVGGTL